MTTQLMPEVIKPKTLQTGTTPVDLLQIAVSQNADLDKLEKLMALQERWEANEARKAYHKAMSVFKADPPKIEKDRHVSYQTAKGKTEYDHASLANVTATINAALSANGLTASWETKQTEKSITVICRITHILGHSESTALSSPPDESGGKNSIQAIGSTVSYLQRYTILSLCGLATSDQDDDGSANSEAQRITPNQLADITALMAKVNGNIAQFCKYFKIINIEDLPASEYPRAVAMLEQKRSK